MERVVHSKVAGLESYPLFFQENYAKYEATKGWLVQIFAEENICIPIKIKSGKFLKQAQFLFPPIRKGYRLSIEDEQIFIEKFISHCRKNRICDFISPPLHYSLFASAPNHSFFTELGIVVVDLKKTEKKMLLSLSSALYSLTLFSVLSALSHCFLLFALFRWSLSISRYSICVLSSSFRVLS